MKTYKAITVGDKLSGKTRLLLQIEKFMDEGKMLNVHELVYIPTVFDNYLNSYDKDDKKKPISLGFWDTTGQEEYDRARPISYPHTDIFLMSFSMVDESQLYNLQVKWIPEIERFLKSNKDSIKHKRFILVAYEANFASRKFGLREKAIEMAKENGNFLGYVEVSSKSAEGVKQVLDLIYDTVTNDEKETSSGFFSKISKDKKKEKNKDIYVYSLSEEATEVKEVPKLDSVDQVKERIDGVISYSPQDASSASLIQKNLLNLGIQTQLLPTESLDPLEDLKNIDKSSKLIDQSLRVIACISESFKITLSCKRQLNYADAMRRQLFPCKLDKSLKIDGWLGLILSGFLYYEIPPQVDQMFTSNLKQLSVAMIPQLNEQDVQQKEIQQEVSKNHIFLSYNWDHQKMMMKLRDYLRENGFKVWMDLDEMKGEMNDRMAEAVEGSILAIVSLTEKYKLSHNCKKELHYLDRQQKPLVALAVDNVVVKGWAGPIVAPYQHVFVEDSSIFSSDTDSSDNNQQKEEQMTQKLEEILVAVRKQLEHKDE